MEDESGDWQCQLLAQALSSYVVDGRAQTTLPLLTAAQDPLDSALLGASLVKKVQLLGDAVDDNAVLIRHVLDGCGRVTTASLVQMANRSHQPGTH